MYCLGCPKGEGDRTRKYFFVSTLFVYNFLSQIYLLILLENFLFYLSRFCAPTSCVTTNEKASALFAMLSCSLILKC